LLKSDCTSSLGEEKVDEIAFSSDYALVKRRLCETDEMMRLLALGNEEVPVANFFDVRAALARVRVEGLFLDEAEVFDLRRALEAVRKLTLFFGKREAGLYPCLTELSEATGNFSPVIQRIDDILNKFGKVKDNASPGLARIRKDIVSVQSSVSRTLNTILKQAQADGYVEKDATPTMRDGRLVIPVSPSYKRKIDGIVHDESATGKTVFIEPEQVVQANNRVRELQGEERREVIRILAEFTAYLRPHFEDIKASQLFLGTIDFLCAKARFSERIGALCPQVDDVCQLEWIKAVHPLLFLSLKKQNKEVVPLDITLNEKQRILLISGPNAGGKSVCLKTVALLQYMLQCGLPLPLHDSSRCGIFERIFIDIGDEQSLENDLSTYSSHLLNMKFFIRNGNEKSLLLIDEFGTGTEPQTGGAIAEAALERFNRKKMFGVITTHYTNLKHYAEDAEGIVNGAMLYDRQGLQPLFRLETGRPGSSFAVEIARKIGLPEDLIAEAAGKTGAEHLDYDKHLQDIVRDKRYWENKRQQIRLKEKRLEETLLRYESELEEINRQRKEIVQKAKNDAQQLLSDANAKIEGTIREIKTAGAEKERTRAARKALDEFKNRILEEDTDVQIPPKLLKKKNKQAANNASQTLQRAENELLVGTSVRLKGQTATGQILELQTKTALVAFGQLKSQVKLEQLEIVSGKQAKKEKRSYENLGRSASEDVRQRKLSFKSEIDLRGMRGDEAIQAVTYFIDDAIIVGVASVRILHGTGTGTLRQLIRQYLGTVHGVRRFHDEHIQMGGAGITVVELE
jgi:DNA mismatch repair protein MutS2